MKINGLDYIAQILLIVGGLNWGLVGLFDYNLVSAIFGESAVSTIIYALVGLSAVYAIATLTKMASPRTYRTA